MKYLLRLTWVMLLMLVLSPAGRVFGQFTGQKVAKIEIRHVGPAAVSDSLIRANIRLKEGEPYSRSVIDEDVRNLYATRYFYNIRISEELVPEGVKVTYVVQGNPLLTDINVVGNKKFTRNKIL